MRLSEWDKDPCIIEDSEKIDKFIEFLGDTWETRVKYLSEELFDDNFRQKKVGNQRFFDITYNKELYARNYVGIVQFEDIKIEVYPKILKNGGSPQHNWQINLLYWLSYCSKIRFPFSYANTAEMDFDDFLEFMIYIFVNYSLEILSSQPFLSYQSIEEETSFLKGRIVFNSYLKNDVATGQWQRFHCEHEPFIYDNLFNRIIKYVSRKLLILSKNDINIRKLENILLLFEEVSDDCFSAKDCEKVIINPLFNEHQDILSLCKLYLSNSLIDIRQEGNRNFCFLIPMEYVFEDFLFGFIEEKYPSLNLKYQSNEWLTTGKEFQIRNDLFIDPHLVIDTKYKVRDVDSGPNGGISHGDLYQMISYALGRNCKNVLLLYPGKITDKLHSFDINSRLLHGRINIQAKDIDITFDDIKQADSILSNRIMELSPFFSSNTLDPKLLNS